MNSTPLKSSGQPLTPLGRYLDPLLIRRLEGLKLRGRTGRLGSGGGGHRGLLRGAGIEFRQHRFYTRGDDLRHLDWKVLARTGRAHVREYEHETNLRCVLMLDGSGSMNFGSGDENKFAYAQRFCAAMAYVLLGQHEAVGLEVIGSRAAMYVAPAAGQSQLPLVIESLDRVTPAGRADVRAAAMVAASRLSRRAMVILVSDLLHDAGQLATAVSALRYQRHDVILACVRHPDELCFPLTGWVKLMGMEGEAARFGRGQDMAASYLRRLRAHDQALRQLAQRHNCPLWQLDTRTELGLNLARLLKDAGRSASPNHRGSDHAGS